MGEWTSIGHAVPINGSEPGHSHVQMRALVRGGEPDVHVGDGEADTDAADPRVRQRPGRPPALRLRRRLTSRQEAARPVRADEAAL